MIKQVIIGIIATVVGGLILWGIQSRANSESKSIMTKSAYKETTLRVSATNSDVEIHQSESEIPYTGGVISSTNSKQIIYLPKGQPLKVNLRGTNATLKLSKSIADQVNVNNSGTNAHVILF